MKLSGLLDLFSVLVLLFVENLCSEERERRFKIGGIEKCDIDIK